MTYSVTIDNFEGPLDLLLHLIKQSDLDIYNISVELITKQYLDYIKQMEQLNLNIASSYLSMAAELIEIKSSMLLPKKEIISDEYEEDPKERLIKKLIEYQNYKEIKDDFKQLESKRNEYFTKKPSEIDGLVIENKISDDINLDTLLSAFQKFIDRAKIKEPLNTKIANKEFSISERSIEIRSLLKSKKNINFADLFDYITKPYVIVTFLSILSLAKNKEIEIIQNNNFDNIIINGVI